MTTDAAALPAATARKAWQQLVSHGSATSYVASVLSVGIDDYLSAFSERYLGENGYEAFKLVLGRNGEGKGTAEGARCCLRRSQERRRGRVTVRVWA